MFNKQQDTAEPQISLGPNSMRKTDDATHRPNNHEGIDTLINDKQLLADRHNKVGCKALLSQSSLDRSHE